MPNYSLMINSRFKPLSYAEIIAPLQQQTELQNQYADQYAALEAQADTLQQRAMAESNSEWAKRYNEYAANLRKSADLLAQQGLDYNSRMAVNEARTSYARDIIPIQEAMKNQAAIAEKSRTMAANPALRMHFGAMPTIDQLIVNPTLTQEGISGSAVEQSAMQLAAQASTRKTSDSFERFKNVWMQQRDTTGYSRDDIQQFLEDASSVPELKDIANRVRTQFSNFEGMDASQKLALEGEIVSGILKGATYKQDVRYQQDPVAMENLRFNNQIRLANYTKGNRGTGKTEEESLLEIRPMRIEASMPLDRATRRAVRRGEMEAPNDTRELTEYMYKADDTSMQNLKSDILQAYGDVDLRGLEFDYKNNRFTPTKTRISKEDLASNDYEIVGITMSPYGSENSDTTRNALNAIVINKKTGETARIDIPRSIHVNAVDATNAVLQRAEIMRLKSMDPNVSQAVRDNALAQYHQYLQDAYQYTSRIFGVNKTKPQEFEQYGW